MALRSRRLLAIRRRLARLLVLVVVVPTMTVTGASGVANAWQLPAPQRERSVPGTEVARRPVGAPNAPTSHSWSAPAPALPAPADATVSVPTAAGAAPARVGASPVSVNAPAGGGAAPGRVRVQVLPRTAAAAAGVDGMLIRLSPVAGSGRVSLALDYSGFRNAYGGDWASRLHLVRLPACAATTPELAGCQAGTVLPGSNDVKAGRVTADIAVPGPSAAGDATQEVATTSGTTTQAAVATGTATDADVVLALTATASGGGGDYKATSLAPSASWQVATQTGSFVWSYPMRVPPVPGDLDVDLALAYSSGSVDGEIATSNNQSSWIGEGFSFSPGFIERRYGSCIDDGVTTKPGDLCYGGEYLSVAFGGRATEMVRDDTTGQWRLREDDGTRVEHLTGAVNGAQNGEYWRLTTTDGTQYYFGRNRLPGWVSGNPETNSTWTVPVFGDDAGEPCHQSTFAASWCQQAYRWNLDNIVDVHGNSLAHYYAKETNYYGRNLTASAGTSYVRGGYLLRTEYGLRAGAEYSTPALAMAVYTVAERCLRSATDCAESNIAVHPEYWPDVPADRLCAAGATCTGKFSPTFFTRKMLTAVTTRVRSGTGYSDVERWNLQHTFPASGDGLGPSLWLSKITNVGLVGGTLTLPAVTLTGIQLTNRVDAAEGLAPMIKYRLSSVLSETGGGLSVSYSPTQCAKGVTMPASPESNTMRCFPLYWLPDGALNPIQDWFHKYVTMQVVATDNTAGAPFDVTSYEYLGGAAWHYDEEYLLPASRRTWSSWRGYQRVRVTHGDSSEQRSQAEYLFLRGMDGDTLPGGATRSVTVTDSEGGTVRDSWRLQGYERESIVYNGPGGAQVSGEIDDPWLSGVTATQGSRQAMLTGTASERTRIALAAGGWRRTQVDTTFDQFGMPSTVSDLADTATAADDKCTRTTYARNTTAWLLDPVARTETVSVACDVTPSRPTDVISDDRSYFDGSTTFGATPTRGDETRTEELADWTTGPVYVMTGHCTVDSYGRTLTSFDAAEHQTSTSYTPATGGPVTSTTETNALGYTTTTTLQPAWGSPASTMDMNGKRTDFAYDPLGRVTGVWLPGRDKATQSASLQFAYTIPTDTTGAVNGPVVVTTRTLRNDGQYNVGYQLFDSLLRPRQTQSPAPGGGRVITDTFYNTRGQAIKVNQDYYNSLAPSPTLFAVADNQVPGQNLTVIDGADRNTADIFRELGVEQWRTTTVYGGDRVDVDPPAGDTATTTITDARDRTVELREYLGGAPSGAYDSTRYTYRPDGNLDTITDAAGNVWHHHYDLRGRLVRVDDPDSGTSTKTYDDLDHMTTSTDGRGRTVAYVYDAGGRRIETHQDSATGPLLTKQVYDTLAKGEQTSSTRYVGADAYVTAVTGYNNLYQPTGASVTIPAVEGKLAGTYTSTTSYNPDGTASTATLPAGGGLSAETLTYGYNELGMLTTLSSPLGTYINDTIWSKLGAVEQRRYGNTGSRIVQAYTYEQGTNRLVRAKTDLELPTGATQADVAYSYDPAGNITRIADTPPSANAPSDTQCFRYDYQRRLTEAWTATDNCAGAPSLAVLGGPAPYWQSYTYDAVGNRRAETQHASTGDTTRTYTYPAAGQAHPHALTSLTQQSPFGTTTSAYEYDAAGNTTARPGQTLSWNAEGDLESVTTATGTTSFLYDGDGNRLIRRDPNNVTLYLGSHTELRLAKVSGVVTGTRYYSDGTGTVAVRTFDAKLYWQIGDQNHTSVMSVDASTLAVTRRRFTPFGAVRGGAVAWKGERGFVDGTMDASLGLVELGEREYDAATGRFLSVDPVIDPGDPQQMNGYTYASNNPITFSDADGNLVNCGPDGFRCGMDPNTDRHTGRYIGPRHPAPAPVHHAAATHHYPVRHVTYSHLPDGGYRPAHASYSPRPRRQYSRLPDGGYEPARNVHYTPYRPPVRPKPKPSLWHRGLHFVAEATGINAARRCISDPNVGDCLQTAIIITSVVIASPVLAEVGSRVAASAAAAGGKAIARQAAGKAAGGLARAARALPDAERAERQRGLVADAERAQAQLRNLRAAERTPVGSRGTIRLYESFNAHAEKYPASTGFPWEGPVDWSPPPSLLADVLKVIVNHTGGSI